MASNEPRSSRRFAAKQLRIARSNQKAVALSKAEARLLKQHYATLPKCDQLEHLPDDMWGEILEWISTHRLATLSRVNKTWHARVMKILRLRRCTYFCCEYRVLPPPYYYRSEKRKCGNHSWTLRVKFPSDGVISIALETGSFYRKVHPFTSVTLASERENGSYEWSPSFEQYIRNHCWSFDVIASDVSPSFMKDGVLLVIVGMLAMTEREVKEALETEQRGEEVRDALDLVPNPNPSNTCTSK